MNLLVKIYERGNDRALGQTKTIWNCQNSINLDDSVTCQTCSNELIFQLFDRQKNDIKMGEGKLSLEHPIGIDI